MTKKIAAAALALTLAFGAGTPLAENIGFSTVIQAEAYTGSNIGDGNYDVCSQPVYSYLTEAGENGYMRVQSAVSGLSGSNNLLIEYYDKDFRIQTQKQIQTKLPIFGAFLKADGYYYILSGQNNKSESSSVEVFNIAKYDKDWNLIGSCGLSDANTVIPFDAGSARMTYANGYLLIRTSHKMYRTPDGLNHQANVTIQVDTKKMAVTDSYTGIMNSSFGYVSHSFNQFIKTDGKNIVAVDHGDGYPRAICLIKYNTDFTTGKFVPGRSCTVYNMLNISGDIGNNYTGAAVGGFEISDSNYIVVGSSRDQNYDHYERTKNIFVSTVSRDPDKASKQGVKLNFLTKYATGAGNAGNPQLVKIDGKHFILLWEQEETRAHEKEAYAAKLDENGNLVGSVTKIDADLSDCQPIVKNGKAVWYTYYNDDVSFYELDSSTLAVKETFNNPVLKTATTGYTSDTSSVTISWNRQDNANGYRIYRYNSSTKKWVNIKTITNNSTSSYKDSGLKSGTVYKYKVKAYKKRNGKTYWGDASDTLAAATTPSKVKITKATKSSSAVRLYWDKVACTGYKIQQLDEATGEWKTVKLAGASATNYKITGLKSDTAYKFRIQAYKTAGSQKAFSVWSATKKATTKK